MKMAAITITYNDGYKLNEWYEHYIEYRDELYLHIIVDNGSDQDYLKKVHDLFSDSIIIERGGNGGATLAYNDGLRCALKDLNVDSIVLIGNDIKMEKGGLTTLYDFLMSNDKYGMVEPVLLAKDSQIVEDFGNSISPYLEMVTYGVGKTYSELVEDYRIVETVTGGMNISKREFYESVGLQNSTLFMYSDEVDMGIRAQKKGWLMAVTKTVVAWHQHINPQNSTMRMPFTSYLRGRNKVYLAGLHFGKKRKVKQFCYHMWKGARGLFVSILKCDVGRIKHEIAFMQGSFMAYNNVMDIKCLMPDYKE